jgi:hypothetical protein
MDWVLVQEALGRGSMHSQIRAFVEQILAIKQDIRPLRKQ